VVATAVGCGVAWGGLVVPALRPLYAYAWFAGFFAAGFLHWALSSDGDLRPLARPAIPR